MNGRKSASRSRPKVKELTIPRPSPARIGRPSWFARPEVGSRRGMSPNPRVPSPSPIHMKGRATLRRVMRGPTARAIREHPVMVGRSYRGRKGSVRGRGIRKGEGADLETTDHGTSSVDTCRKEERSRREVRTRQRGNERGDAHLGSTWGGRTTARGIQDLLEGGKVSL